MTDQPMSAAAAAALPEEPHHPDCDGWMSPHRSRIVLRDTNGRGVKRAECDDVEGCGWVGTLVGPDAVDLAVGEMRAHAAGSPVECDGRCRSWT